MGNYPTDPKGGLISNTRAIKTIQLQTLTGTATRKLEEMRPEEGLLELDLLHMQTQSLKTVRQQAEQGDFTQYQKLLLPRHKQAVLFGGSDDANLSKPLDWGKLTPEQTKNLLNIVAKEKQPFTHIEIPDCQHLLLEKLYELLRFSPDLKSLKLEKHAALDSSAVLRIEEICPCLEELTLINMSALKDDLTIFSSTLKRFTLKQNYLTHLTLETPQLTQLRCMENKKLAQITNIPTSIVYMEFHNCPKLETLQSENFSACKAIQTFKAEKTLKLNYAKGLAQAPYLIQLVRTLYEAAINVLAEEFESENKELNLEAVKLSLEQDLFFNEMKEWKNKKIEEKVNVPPNEVFLAREKTEENKAKEKININSYEYIYNARKAHKLCEKLEKSHQKIYAIKNEYYKQDEKSRNSSYSDEQWVDQFPMLTRENYQILEKWSKKAIRIIDNLRDLNIDDDKVINILSKFIIVDFENSTVREIAIEAIIKFGKANDRIINFLINALSEQRKKNCSIGRYQAASALGESGVNSRKVISALVKAATKETAYQEEYGANKHQTFENISNRKSYAISALGKLAVINKKVIDVITKALNGHCIHLRTNAVIAIWKLKIKTEPIIKALVERLYYNGKSDKSKTVRSWCAQALGELGVSNVIVLDSLLGSLSESYNSPLDYCVWALEKLTVSHEIICNALLKRLKLKHDSLTDRVIECLGKLGKGNDTVTNRLLKITSSWKHSPAPQALLNLGILNKSIFLRIVHTLPDDSKYWNNDSALQTLRNHLKFELSNEFLVELRSYEKVDLFTALMKISVASRKEMNRLTALNLIVELKLFHNVNINSMLHILIKESYAPIRIKAIGIITINAISELHIANQPVTNSLTKILTEDKDEKIRCAAAELLHKICNVENCSEQTIKALSEVSLQDENEKIRDLTSYSLGLLGIKTDNSIIQLQKNLKKRPEACITLIAFGADPQKHETSLWLTLFTASGLHYCWRAFEHLATLKQIPESILTKAYLLEKENPAARIEQALSCLGKQSHLPVLKKILEILNQNRTFFQDKKDTVNSRLTIILQGMAGIKFSENQYPSPDELFITLTKRNLKKFSAEKNKITLNSKLFQETNVDNFLFFNNLKPELDFSSTNPITKPLGSSSENKKILNSHLQLIQKGSKGIKISENENSIESEPFITIPKRSLKPLSEQISELKIIPIKPTPNPFYSDFKESAKYLLFSAKKNCPTLYNSKSNRKLHLGRILFFAFNRENKISEGDEIEAALKDNFNVTIKWRG